MKSAILASNALPVQVYEWNAWHNTLFCAINKHAIRLEAKIRQPVSDIVEKLSVDRGYFLFHVNLTKTDGFFSNKAELLIRLKNKGIIPLNAFINDISKRNLQNVCERTGLHTTRASADGDGNELLIIKTNLNYGGRQEQKLSWWQLRRLSVSKQKHDVGVVYPVLERNKIKSAFWRDKSLVIEKYIANENNYTYRAYKLIDKIVISEAIETGLIKKMITVEQRVNYCYDIDEANALVASGSRFGDLIDCILRLSYALNLDFAALDIVRSDDNKYYVVDVNITPSWNKKDHTEMLSFLATAFNATTITATGTNAP